MRSEETMEYSHFSKKIPMRGGMRDRIDVGGEPCYPAFALHSVARESGRESGRKSPLYLSVITR